MPRQQADAILDRVIHNAYGIELAGESMCERRMSNRGQQNVLGPLPRAVRGLCASAGRRSRCALHNFQRPPMDDASKLLRSFELSGRRLQLLRDAAPAIARVAVLVNPRVPLGRPGSASPRMQPSFSA
jgi:hypothetical protein